MNKERREPCPKCRERGADRSGDNLVLFPDGGGHCFACGHHVFPSIFERFQKVKEEDGAKSEKGPLPRDFTREVPAVAWKWLLKFGLPYSYWKPYTGYSPADERLVLTVGNPTKFSQGRYLGTEEGRRKWFFYGDPRSAPVEVLGDPFADPTKRLVLVEDLISAHKVGQVAPAICLFGTNISDEVIRVLKALRSPVVVWLDGDQYSTIHKKVNRLQTFLAYPVSFVSTEKDPKEHSLDEIPSILRE
jgi:hypothetical protein